MARTVIALLGQPIVKDEEALAVGSTITPGHLIQYNAAGNIIKNTQSSQVVARNFVLERDEMGDDIDVAYAAGDQVKVGQFHVGMHVYAFTPSGQNILKGSFLTGDATGCVVLTSGSDRIAMSLEAVNNTAGPGDVRIRIEIV